MGPSIKLGYLFPGQGAQFVGMGRDLADAFPSARKVFDQADSELGFSISKLCFDGSEEELTRTLYAQPAILVTSLAALAVFNEKFQGIEPAFVAGLSLGEFTALVAAGAMTYSDGLKLVKLRAEAMEKSARIHPGSMASVMGLNASDCKVIANEAGCEVANLNAPDQIVLSGTKESIDKACALARAKGAKRAMPLKVGGAFHSSLMREAKEMLGSALDGTMIRQPSCVFVPNAVGKQVSDPAEIKNLLSQQLMSPVQWVDTMTQAAQAEVPFFLEMGPGKVLKGLARRGETPVEVLPAGTVVDIDKLDERLKTLQTGG
ncbi:MAG: ACP S-malonyltransferase [Candidatus Omnitrophota bacterium]|nr:ACP S-malonyltransferase [Candidatus Omnitrophota bacterium]